jgi:sugar phosphate isomerase/epimerase
MEFKFEGVDETMQSMTRRSILKGGIAMTAAAGVSTVIPNALYGESLVAVPGIQLYTVDKELKANVEETLKKVRAIGYGEVETAGFGGYSPKQFRTALQNAGLRCRSSHFFNVGGDDPSQILEAANTLGVHYVVSSGISRFTEKPAGAAMRADDYKAMAQFFNEFGRQAKQAGLQFAYHNHNSEFQDFGQGKVGYDALIEHTDADLVKLELDCGWMVAAGHDPVQYFHRYPNRYRMVHIKDFVKPAQPSTSLASQDVPQGTVLGTGCIDYRPILQAAKAAGVEHFYVEQEPPFIGMTALEAATKDYAYISILPE